MTIGERPLGTLANRQEAQGINDTCNEKRRHFLSHVTYNKRSGIGGFMNTVSQMQALNMILETIKFGAADNGVNRQYLAELAGFAQVLLCGAEVEHDSALKSAHRLMNVVAAERSRA